jgi:hypothetical protein
MADVIIPDQYLYMSEGTAGKEGSCNFCVDKLHTKVYILKSNHPQRNLVIKLCSRCMFELIKYIIDKEVMMYGIKEGTIK